MFRNDPLKGLIKHKLSHTVDTFTYSFKMQKFENNNLIVSDTLFEIE